MGHGRCCTCHYWLVMNRLGKNEFSIFSSFVESLLPKDLTNQNFGSVVVFSVLVLWWLKMWLCLLSLIVRYKNRK